MPMRYANDDDVYAQLGIDSGNPASAETVAAVERLEHGLADAFDARIERSFGLAAAPETRDVTPAQPTPRLIVPAGIWELEGIAIGGTWDGTAWQDGEAVAATGYRLTLLDQRGLYWGIDRLDGIWSGTVRVTATWGDQGDADVPADVEAALTFLTIRQWRRLTSAPTELVGPDGFTVPTPHAWDDPLVTTAIDHHRVVRLVI